MKNEAVEKVLITEEEISGRISYLAEKISKDYEGKELICVGILKGSVVFLADIIRKISVPLSIDFMTVSSYGNSTETCGELKIKKDRENDL